MKRFNLTILLLSAAAASAIAAAPARGLRADSLAIDRDGGYLTVEIGRAHV